MIAADLALYNGTAQASASVVIRRYSTSFGWACRILDPISRRHIENIYALVRLADELVDGPAESAGVDNSTRHVLLAELEAETERALSLGFSTNLIVHAFALTANDHGIGMDLCEPFFASMRRDLDQTDYEPDELDEYVYGSAEVVGLMCLQVFERDQMRSYTETALLTTGARRLGSAFQLINFLRDYASDHDERGRSYLPGSTTTLTDEGKAAVVASIRDDLREADRSIPLLNSGCRAAVWAARTLFSELTDRIDSTPASIIVTTRVRVPTAIKARIFARALVMRNLT
ncbi:phytoene/squalene synthase family protein [Paramicrobacterium fandaimingii]|uniref:phytoene/squalene synthase family protein n=1 Tax=Paramicrobacterium fandaimingii TaxID=2708079 RepID=UPI001422C3BF|nr:phytoene/squalene synthase family protein [Microbacterium fandaimingii]